MNELDAGRVPTVDDGPTADGPTFSVLVVAYRCGDLVLEALRGLYEHTRRDDFEVLLTDCSQDGTEDRVAAAFPQVRVVPAPGNLGFAGGNNFLAGHARGRLLLLLNPDVLVTDDAIGALVACAEARPEAGAWGGVTLLTDGSIDPSCRQSLPTAGRLALGVAGLASRTDGGLDADETEAREVEALTGAFMLVDRAVWDELGGFDLSFFMYAEELDLCHRIRQSGRPIVMTPRAKITHLVGRGSALSPRRVTAIHRAKMHFFRKHNGRLFSWYGGVALWLTALNRWLKGTVVGLTAGSDRSKRLREGNAAVVFKPSDWWGGYDGSSPSGN